MKRALFMLVFAAAAAVSGGAAPNPPRNLRVEYHSLPLGLDAPKPRLSWELDDSRRGAVQTAWQVLAASAPDLLREGSADIWDSGKVSSGQSIQIEYSGKPLESRRRYYWTVRAWDRDGAPSAFAEPAWWEMGLLSSNDWHAQWITMRYEELEPKQEWEQQPVQPGKWIWLPETKGKTQACFRKEFEIPENARVLRAELAVAADDQYVLHVNGKETGAGSGPKFFDRYEITDEIRPGWNVLALQAVNREGPCGLLIGALVQYVEKTDGAFSPDEVKTLDLASDRNPPAPPSLEDKAAVKISPWLVTDEPDDEWTEIDFDTGWIDEDTGSLYVHGQDAPWILPLVIGPYGCDPWKQVGERPSRMRRSILLRKEFHLDEAPLRARVYSSGLGVYELYINGGRVGDDVFAPGWTFYPKRLQYQVYDVTALLKPGDNAVAAWLGSGWWNGMDGRGGQPPRLLLELEFEYGGGSGDAIATDESWDAYLSPVLSDSFYHGEMYDARLEMPGWNEPGFNGADRQPALALPSPLDSFIGTGLPNNPVIKTEPWRHPAERLVAQRDPPIRVIEELQARSVNSPAPGVYVFDFGQNAAGRCRLKVNAPAGAEIRIRHSEVLNPDGTLYTGNYRSARVTDTYICKGGGEEVWEPRFTYRGFRYAELTGYPGAPPRDALVFRVLHSDATLAGKFECANPLLNRIHSNVLWTWRSNLHSVPTDCPQRDERLGWTDVSQGPGACWALDMAAFFGKWMRDFSDGGGAKSESWYSMGGVVQGHGPGWADALTIVPWTLHLFYGDTRILEEMYADMTAFVEGRRARAGDKLYDFEGYGDWCAPGDWGELVSKPKKLIGSAYYYYSIRLLSRMAAAIGRTEDAARYAALAGAVAQAFNEKYFDAENNFYPPGPQTTLVLPLHFGLVPPERRKAVADNLVKDIAARDYHLATGFLGTAYLLPALAEAGEHAVAYRLAAQITCPSWGYMVEQNATTVWELWDSDKQGPGMNSRNHCSLGTIERWFFESLAGINPDPAQPGFKRIVIRPAPAGELQWAKAEYPSMHGLIRSAWRIEAGRFVLEATVPANTSAEVHVPAAPDSEVLEGDTPAGSAVGVREMRAQDGARVFEVGAGEYRFMSSPWPPPQ